MEDRCIDVAYSRLSTKFECRFCGFAKTVFVCCLFSCRSVNCNSQHPKKQYSVLSHACTCGVPTSFILPNQQLLLLSANHRAAFHCWRWYSWRFSALIFSFVPILILLFSEAFLMVHFIADALTRSI